MEGVCSKCLGKHLKRGNAAFGEVSVFQTSGSIDCKGLSFKYYNYL